MPVNDFIPDYEKAIAFFQRAQQVASTGNFDYGIELFLEGLRCAPDELENGHLKLRELAITRKRKGLSKPSMLERIKPHREKDPIEQMLHAEYLFAKDPEYIPYAESMLKAAVAADLKKTAKWIADLIFQANNSSKKPSLQTYLLLKDSYAQMQEFDFALAACQRASKLKPQDAELAEEFKRLSAELTVSRGKYDQEGDFRKSIKDREIQEKMQAQEGVVKSDDFRNIALESAKKDFAGDPHLQKNILNLADVLSDMENDASENHAIAVLEEAYKTKTDFIYKERAERIKIKQLKRKIRTFEETIQKNPNDTVAKASRNDLIKQLQNTEIGFYRLYVSNYPTDPRAKYEYALRLISSKQYDDAIPFLQEAQKDPRYRIIAMSKIGLCFLLKGWLQDATDVFTQAMDLYEIKDDEIAKELQYNLGLAYEQMGDKNKAIEIYRKIAQLDFSYKDVRLRVDKLRSQQ